MSRNKEDNRAAQAESTARIQIKFVMDNLRLLDFSSQSYARSLYKQKEPFHPYKSQRGNERHQLQDIENLYEKVWSKTSYGSVEQKKEKYERFRR